MLHALFLKHPRALGLSYGEHRRRAFRVAGTMIVAGGCCAAHALVPALFETTASSAIARLHERMAGNGERTPGTGGASGD